VVNSGALFRVAIWGGLGLLAIVALAVVIFVVRKSLLGDRESSPSGGLDLNTLMEMRDNGTLTEAEYRQLRSRVSVDVLGKR
jgi:hypothetical protein